MRRIHIALGVSDIDASVQDYSKRLQAAPTLVVPKQYALWRTDTINFSVRKVADMEVGALRHLGWEEDTSAAFSAETDVNGVVWERFSAEQQLAEIRSLWAEADYVPPQTSTKPVSANPALLIIDVQQAIDHPSWGRRNNPNAEVHMRELLSEWRRRAWPIVHIRHQSLEPDSTYRPGQQGCEFKTEVQPAPDERVITKHTNSAFIGTDLELWLTKNHVHTLVICGVITNNSVETTVRMAGNLGYRTFLVADATATFDMTDFDGRLRTAEEVHAMSLANLEHEYATVTTADQLTRQLDLLGARQHSPSLQDLRFCIDQLDRKMVTLLAQRAHHVARVATFKSTSADVAAPDRVEQVIVKVKALANELALDPALVERVYRTLIAELMAAELREHASSHTNATPLRSSEA